MQTGQRGFSARENRLEESTQDSREARQRTRSAVTHSAALALMKLAKSVVNTQTNYKARWSLSAVVCWRW